MFLLYNLSHTQLSHSPPPTRPNQHTLQIPPGGQFTSTVVLGGERGVMKYQMWGNDIPNTPNTDVFNVVQDSILRSIDVWMSK